MLDMDERKKQPKLTRVPNQLPPTGHCLLGEGENQSKYGIVVAQTLEAADRN